MKHTLQLALDALEQIKGELYEEVYVNGLTGVLDKPIAAIKEALAQADQERPQNCGTGYCSCIECVMEPEPVAWLHRQGNFTEVCMNRLHDDEIDRGWTEEPLYTTPPQRTWVGLDNDDLVWIYSNSDKVGQAISNTEAKLKEKNALA